MAKVLDVEPQANAVGAPPASGRSRARDSEKLLQERALVANLYALRGAFVERCRKLGVRITLKP